MSYLDNDEPELEWWVWVLLVGVVVLFTLLLWGLAHAAEQVTVEETYTEVRHYGTVQITTREDYSSGSPETLDGMVIRIPDGPSWEFTDVTAMADPVSMPDAKLLDPEAAVEWLEVIDNGQPSTWSTGNNYAEPGTLHAANQRKMGDFLNTFGPRVRVVTGTAAEFLGKMAKWGLRAFGILGLIPDATAANEGAEIDWPAPWEVPVMPEPVELPGFDWDWVDPVEPWSPWDSFDPWDNIPGWDGGWAWA